MNFFSNREYFIMNLKNLKIKHIDMYEPILSQVINLFKSWGENGSYLKLGKSHNTDFEEDVFCCIIYKNGINRMACDENWFDYKGNLDVLVNCFNTKTPILAGILVLHNRHFCYDFKYSTEFRYIKIVEASFRNLRIGTLLLHRVSDLKKKLLVPLDIIEQSIGFWMRYFVTIYKLLYVKHYQLFIKQNGLSRKLHWELLIEFLRENEELYLMAKNDVPILTSVEVI